MLVPSVFEKSKNLDSYEKVKGDLFIRLMNVVKYRDELKNAIFRTVGDIALVLYARMGELDGCSTSIKIKKHMLQKWEQDEQSVFNEALFEIRILFRHQEFIAGRNFYIIWIMKARIL